MKYISRLINVNRGRNPIKIVLALAVVTPLVVIICILIHLINFLDKLEEGVTSLGVPVIDWAMTRKHETTND